MKLPEEEVVVVVVRSRSKFCTISKIVSVDE